MSASKGAVTVLGTQFSVRAGTDATEVTVLQGRVQVASQAQGKAKAVVLVKGQSSRVDDEKIVVAPVDASKILSWKEGFIHFSGETLEEVIAELNRYYSQELLLENVTFASKRVVVVLSLDNSLMANAQIIAGNTGLKAKESPSKKRITLAPVDAEDQRIAPFE